MAGIGRETGDVTGSERTDPGEVSDAETACSVPVVSVVGAPLVGQRPVSSVVEKVQEDVERVVHGVGVVEGRSLEGVGDAREAAAAPEGSGVTEVAVAGVSVPDPQGPSERSRRAGATEGEHTLGGRDDREWKLQEEVVLPQPDPVPHFIRALGQRPVKVHGEGRERSRGVVGVDCSMIVGSYSHVLHS